MTLGRALARLPVVFCACLAFVALRRRRPGARPVFGCLLALAAIDVARLLPLPAWADAWLWCVWPAPTAALAWRTWKDETPEVARRGLCDCSPVAPSPDDLSVATPGVTPDGLRLLGRAPCTRPRLARRAHDSPQHAPCAAAWQAVAFTFVAYATVLVLPRSFWPAHPLMWSAARAAPYWAGPALAVLAWALCKDEALGEPPRGLAAGPSPAPRGLSRRINGAACASPRGLHRDLHLRGAPAQVTAVLVISAILDVAIGALARPGLSWKLAWATSTFTWALVAGLILWDLRRVRRSPCSTENVSRGS